MEIKKVRKSDLKELISKALKMKFELQDSDYEIDINTIYAVIKINSPVITRKNSFEKSYKEDDFSRYIELITFSNIKVVYRNIHIVSETETHVTDIELAVNYEIIDE